MKNQTINDSASESIMQAIFQLSSARKPKYVADAAIPGNQLLDNNITLHMLPGNKHTSIINQSNSEFLQVAPTGNLCASF